MFGEVFLECLPEPFDLALRGQLVGAPVLLGDALDTEECFERVQAGLSSAAGESRGVDHAIVGEGGCRISAVLGGPGGCCGHDPSGHSVVDAEVGEESGVVIEPGDDLGLAAIGQAPVREVGLPHLVGLCGLEALPGRSGAFLGLRGDRFRAF